MERRKTLHDDAVRDCLSAQPLHLRFSVGQLTINQIQIDCVVWIDIARFLARYNPTDIVERHDGEAIVVNGRVEEMRGREA